MDKKPEKSLQNRINNTLPTLNEYQRRTYLSSEAKEIGYGGISIVSRISGVSRKTLRKGITELESHSGTMLKSGKIRKEGGGRKPLWKTKPGILEKLKELVQPHTKGGPISTLLWTNKSLRRLSAELNAEGYKASHRVVGKMLKRVGYSLQANKKALTAIPSHPDRNEQFEYIDTQINAANLGGNPVCQEKRTHRKFQEQRVHLSGKG